MPDASVPTTAFQDPLFEPTRWLERTTDAGTVVRVRVTRVGPGLVRIERYERRRADEHRFSGRPAEEGRTVPLASLAPGVDEVRLFGVASDHHADPHPPDGEGEQRRPEQE